MSFKHKCRSLLLIGGLFAGLLSGAPLRPEEVEKLLRQLNQPKVAHSLKQEEEGDDEAPL